MSNSFLLTFFVYFALGGIVCAQTGPSFEGSGNGSTPQTDTTSWTTTMTTGSTPRETTVTTTTTTSNPTPIEELFCEEVTTVYPNNDTVQINVTFPRTPAGFTISSIDTCGDGTSNSGKPYGTRQCSINGVWLDPLWLSSCNTNLNDLANTPIENEEQRQQVVTDVVTLTSEPELLSPMDIANSTQALTAVTNTSSLTQNTSELVVAAVGNLLSVPLSDLEASDSAQQLLGTLNDVVAKLNLSDGVEEFQTVSSTVGVSVLETRNITGSISFVASAVANQSVGFRSDQFLTLNGTKPDQSYAASIVVSQEAVSKGNRTGFFGFLNDNVFRASESQQTNGFQCEVSEDARVNSPIVISATVPGVSIQGLQDMINITFRDLNITETITTNNTFCSFWNETENFWSTKGCTTVRADNNTAECLCNHLTNFATLFTKEDLSDKVNDVLNIITAVGSSISIAACLLTIVCIVFLWRRRNLPTQLRTFAMLAFLSFALLLLNAFLIASLFDEVQNSPKACEAIAILLHYSLLSALCWMMVEAIYLNIAVTQPIYFKIKLQSKRVYICSFLWGWVAPAIFVGVTAGVKIEIYTSEHMCWIDSEYLVYVVIAPTAVILSINLLSYISVIAIAVFRKRPGRVNIANARKRNIVLSLSLFVIFGLTWIIGFVLFATTESDSLLPLYCVFTIFNSLQGLLVFLLFIVRNQAMRNSLIREITKLSSASVLTTQAVQPKYRKRGSVVVNRYSNSSDNVQRASP